MKYITLKEIVRVYIMKNVCYHKNKAMMRQLWGLKTNGKKWKCHQLNYKIWKSLLD